MNRVISIGVLLCVIGLAVPRTSAAFDVNGTLVIVAPGAYAYVYSSSLATEVFVHKLKVTSRITHDGVEIDKTTVECLKQADPLGLPTDLVCTSYAFDYNVMAGCTYCGNGISKAYSYTFIEELFVLIGTKYWAPSCREYHPGQGPGGGSGEPNDPDPP